MSRRSLRERIRWRTQHHCRQLLARTVARPVYCAGCGRELFRTRPTVIRGRVRLIGALETNVRVAFTAKETLEFRHLELDQCPAPERPWVR